jgi:hypothetical protein
MKIAHRMIVLSCFCIGCLGFLTAVEPQEIKTVDDVNIIQNKKTPAAPKGTPTKIVAELDRIIGESDDLEKSFSQLGGFVVDDEGIIYALDFKEQKIKVFDAEGQFIRSFGEKGQGPGELQMPSDLHLAPGDELAVNDALARKMVYFTKQGRYKREVSYATRLALVSLLMDPFGDFVGREMKLEGQEMFFEIVKLDSSMKSLFSLDKMGFPIPLPGSGTKINLMDMISIYQFDSSGNLYYGRNRNYEINVYTPEGKLVKSIRKDFQPQKITEEDKKEILNRLDNVPNMGPVNLRDMFEFPKTFPPFQLFTIDENGRIIVRTWEKGNEKDEFIHDVFDPEGRFIAQFPTKVNFTIWKNGNGYAADENEEGLNVIKKYKIRWER